MLGSAISALSDRLDAKFLTAYWLPAFVAVLGGFGVLAMLVGPEQLDAWVYNLDSVEQSLGVLLIVLLVSMLAFVLRAMTRPIVELYGGAALPRSVAEWSKRGQLRAKTMAAQLLDASDPPESNPRARAASRFLDRRFPEDDASLQPTLLGNVLATAVEHPRFAYSMEGALWWPRLSPLVPSFFQDTLAGAQAPMMALLNLSVVCVGLALIAVALLGLVGGQWAPALIGLIGGLTLSRLCYRAAVSQAAEVGSLLRVAFDLYRYDILTQLDLQHPGDLAAERALWLRLTDQVLGEAEEPVASDGQPGPTRSDTSAAGTPESTPSKT